MLGRGKNDDDGDILVDEREIPKIKDRLDEGETIAMSVRQSRVRAGGSPWSIRTPFFLQTRGL